MTPVLLSDRPATYAARRDGALAANTVGATIVAPIPLRPHLREEDLAHLWEGQRFPPGALRTRDGRALQVVYRGRRGGGSGPDFIDAIIADDRGRLLRGDVELHVRASAFCGHGHHRDSRYDNLILHVVFEDDTSEDTLLSCGRRTAVVALAPWVARRSGQLRLWLVQPSLWEEPCREAVPRLGWPQVHETLARLGQMRFRQKQSRFALALRRDGANQVLYEGLLRALGYSRNQEAFAYLARLHSYERLKQALDQDGGPALVEALLLEAPAFSPANAGSPPRPPSPMSRIWSGAGPLTRGRWYRQSSGAGTVTARRISRRGGWRRWSASCAAGRACWPVCRSCPLPKMNARRGASFPCGRCPPTASGAVTTT